MLRKTVFAIAILLLAVGACERQAEVVQLSPAGSEGAEASPPSGIVGPSWQSWEQAKGVVLVRPGGGMCTGTLIDPEVVLTAGHCVKLNDAQGNYDYTTNPSGLSVEAGPTAYNASSIGTPEQIVTHPSWTGNIQESQTDLAMIKLSAPVTDIEPFGVRDYPVPESGSDGLLVGYGEDGSMWGGAGTQRIGETTLLNVMALLIETGDPCNTCSGDSGGPLFTQQDEQWVISGVTSFGTSTQCSETGGGYSVNLLGYCHWLNTAMIDLTGHDLGLEECVQCVEEVVDDWGQGCGPDLPACPEGTQCTPVQGYSDGFYGFCSTVCCETGAADPTYCFDVAPGEELCALTGGDGTSYCAIQCETDADCPEHADCVSPSTVGPSLCMATAPSSSDADADADSDADSDSDVDGDTDTAVDESSSEGDSGSCAAGAPGRRGGGNGLAAMLSVLW